MFYTGALPDRQDKRDFNAEPLLGAAPAVDFENNPLFLPKPPLWNQNASDACVGASWSYYHWQLKGEIFSKRDLFARIAQAYGAYIRDGGVTLVKIGQQTETELPDPQFPDANNMRDKTGLNDQQAIDDRELNSYSFNNTIDDCAKCIRDFKGCVFGVVGSENGWKDKENPTPPKSGEATWGHALYLYGYHLHDGQKCVIARSSWSETDHHIKQNYFESGNTFNPWVLIPRSIMEILQVVGEATLVVKNLDGKYYQIATAPELYPYVAKILGLEGKAFGTISRAEVDLNLGGDLTAGLSFISK